MMKTVADPAILNDLLARLRALRPDSPRRWGTLTPHEMLCHLGDATAMVLRQRPAVPPSPIRARPLMRWVGLWAPLPWPRGYPTRPSLDPKAEGTRPGDFEADRERAIAGLKGVAGAAPGDLVPAHGAFGTMSLRDWHRWAYRHTHHHLRQFGL